MSSPRTARHARPRLLSRPAVRKAALAGGVVGVLAVPVSATLIAESPLEASAAARTDRVLPLVDATVDPARLAAYASQTDAAVGRQMAVAAMDVAAQQAAAAAAAAAQQAAAAAAAAEAQRVADEQAAQARASRSRDVSDTADVPAASGDPRSIARAMLAARGQASQFSCLDSLWTKESGWSTSADNPTSSAYGIPQALPGSKMATAGADWRTNPATQIAWGLSYIQSRYGGPCAAWSHSRASNWY